jgi:Mn2+/Fe2+ NRAMP family transporter
VRSAVRRPQQAGETSATLFRAASGNIGYRLFGAVFLASALTSIIGAAYTSVSFLTVFNPDMTERQRNHATVASILLSLICCLTWYMAAKSVGPIFAMLGF